MSEPKAEWTGMGGTVPLEVISCPCCGAREYSAWAEEVGFTAVRCAICGLIYVNPRPVLSAIDAAVRSGVHRLEGGQLNVKARHSPRKVARYRRLLANLFEDVWSAGRSVSWLDVGAGYGEVGEAVGGLAPAGSTVEGLEPMKHKADHARARGLAVSEGYLGPDREKVDFVSVVDVFSHIPQFDHFLSDVRDVLHPDGEILVETGNLADLGSRDELPGELGLPDHLVFAGERQLRGYLERAGFAIVKVARVRVDGVVNLAKNLIKKTLGRPVSLTMPYTSSYRQLLVRARLCGERPPGGRGAPEDLGT